jgi:hypothetical protein
VILTQVIIISHNLTYLTSYQFQWFILSCYSYKAWTACPTPTLTMNYVIFLNYYWYRHVSVRCPSLSSCFIVTVTISPLWIYLHDMINCSLSDFETLSVQMISFIFVMQVMALASLSLSLE